jgi:hypothetical protein
MVVPVGRQPQVGRIAARPVRAPLAGPALRRIVAGVIDVHGFAVLVYLRDRPVLKLECEAVGSRDSLFAAVATDVELAITATHLARRPRPAPIRG